MMDMTATELNMEQINERLKQIGFLFRLTNKCATLNEMKEIDEIIDKYMIHKYNVLNNIPDGGPGISAMSGHVYQTVYEINSQ